MTEHPRIRLTREDLERVLADFTPSTEGVEVGKPTSREDGWWCTIYAPSPRRMKPQGSVTFWDVGGGYVEIEANPGDFRPPSLFRPTVDELLGALGVAGYEPPTEEPKLPGFGDPIEAWRKWRDRQAEQIGGMLSYGQFANAVGLEARDHQHPGSPMDLWFRWHHLAVDLGYPASLSDLAAQMGRAPSTVKNLHAPWAKQYRSGTGSTKLVPN